MQSEEIPFRFEDGVNASELNPETGEMDTSYPQTRWIKTMQLDFAARADWCIKSFKEANHAPNVRVEEGNRITATSGGTVNLTLSATDPDAHPVALKAWSYGEAGDGDASISVLENKASVLLPVNAKKGEKFHIIVAGTETGFPSLTCYQRVIFTIK